MGAGATIRAKRLALNLTQEQLATMAGVSREWLSTVERDLVEQPGWSRLERVARALDLVPEDVLAEAGYRVDRPPVEEWSLEEILTEIERLTTRARQLMGGTHARKNVPTTADESGPRTRVQAARPRPGSRRDPVLV